LTWNECENPLGDMQLSDFPLGSRFGGHL
jgi:hypothetical protein